MANDEIVTIRLPRNHVGQIIDGLEMRLEVWKATHEYFVNGYTREPVMIEECNSTNEAAGIVEFYQEIIAELRRQLKASSTRST